MLPFNSMLPLLVSAYATTYNVIWGYGLGGDASDGGTLSVSLNDVVQLSWGFGYKRKVVSDHPAPHLV